MPRDYWLGLRGQESMTTRMPTSASHFASNCGRAVGLRPATRESDRGYSRLPLFARRCLARGRASHWASAARYSPAEPVDCLSPLCGGARHCWRRAVVEGLRRFTVALLPCYRWHGSVIVPPDDALASVGKLTLRALIAYPQITYTFGFTGSSSLHETFARRPHSERSETW